MRRSGRASGDSRYSIEVNCTRCKEPYVKEVKAGDRLTQRRNWKGDTRGMCSFCKFKVNAVIYGITGIVALVIFAIIALVS